MKWVLACRYWRGESDHQPLVSSAPTAALLGLQSWPIVFKSSAGRGTPDERIPSRKRSSCVPRGGSRAQGVSPQPRAPTADTQCGYHTREGYNKSNAKRDKSKKKDEGRQPIQAVRGRRLLDVAGASSISREGGAHPDTRPARLT